MDETYPTPPPLCGSDALLLDFDGTLVELAPRPDAIAVDPALPGLLGALAAQLGGALAVISGRPLAELQHWLGAELTLIGVHGAEANLPLPGAREIAPLPAAVGEALEPLCRRHPGVWLEPKRYALGVHYREAPGAEEDVLQACATVAQDYGLERLCGKCIVELRHADIHKGAALQRLLQHPRYAGRRPLMLGDDRTDEDAFVAAQDAGGCGIKVGGGASQARCRLASVADVHAWLRAQAEQLDAGESP